MRSTAMLTRIALSCLLAVMLAGCSSEDAPQRPAADELASTERTAVSSEQTVSEEEVPMSEFLADSLHPIEPAAPGRFRLEVAGEVHEGELGSCGWSLRTAEGQNQDRFAAAANWRSGDGRSMQLEIWRIVMHDEFFWNSSHGHESERVQLRLRDDGGSLASVQDTAVSEMRVIRARPDSSPTWRWGAGDIPAVRVVADGPQATAVGELHGQDNEYGSPLTGPFSLAVRCAGN